MENPFELPVPEDTIERTHAIARDLAYGVAQGWWDPSFSTFTDIRPYDNDVSRASYSQFKNKWGSKRNYNHLLLFEYVSVRDERQHGNLGIVTTYLLTEKALRLLEKPTAPPSVFISYRRDQSSPFALLVEARLRLAGNPNRFVDKLIVAGEGWRERLKEAIEQSKYFVCLVGPETLDSEWVQTEIEWAAAAGCTLISIWHGCEMGDDCPAALRERHAITVTGESAREYETAISELLNALGYATY